MNAGTYISLFTNWAEPVMNSVWLGTRLNEWNDNMFAEAYDEVCEVKFHGASLIQKTHPAFRSPENVVESGVGMWHEKIYHFKPEGEPSSGGDEIQSEFFVNLEDLGDAMNTLMSLKHIFAEYVQISEIRPVAKSNIILQPAYGKNVVGIHFTWKKDFPNVMEAVEVIKIALRVYKYRVHWGKYFGHLEKKYIYRIYGTELAQIKALHESSGVLGPSKLSSCFVDRLLFDKDNKEDFKCSFENDLDKKWHQVFGDDLTQADLE